MGYPLLNGRLGRSQTVPARAIKIAPKKAVQKKRVPTKRLGEPGIGNGATARTRTAGLLITNQLLYQLSYGGKSWIGLVSWAFRAVKPLFEIWKNWPK